MSEGKLYEKVVPTYYISAKDLNNPYALAAIERAERVRATLDEAKADFPDNTSLEYYDIVHETLDMDKWFMAVQAWRKKWFGSTNVKDTIKEP